MRLVIISGRSGSGKSVALHVLEDIGYYSVDNLPVVLLKPLVDNMVAQPEKFQRNIAVSIDARNLAHDIEKFPSIIDEVEKNPRITTEILYLDADEKTLLKRFSSTRRKHPLSNNQVALPEALQLEKQYLGPIASKADLMVNTTNLTLYQLRDIVKQRVADKIGDEMAVLFISFGFKSGIPVDADVVFDVRCLPNPYWIPELREHRGTEDVVANYLSEQPQVNEMLEDICKYLDKWLPRFKSNNRSYMTVAIGCTGGHHRSVYLVERLYKTYKDSLVNVQSRHRDLTR